MKALLALSILLTVGSMSASAAEGIEASTWEDSSYNVAQVVRNQNLKGLGFSAQITTVYRGGILAPFGVLLSIWDPIPQDGGDFGTVKTFDLGNFSSTPTILAKKLRKVSGDESILQLVLKMSYPNSDATDTKPGKFKVSVSIRGGEVKEPLLLKQIK